VTRKTVRVKYVKSAIGSTGPQKRTLRALGLKRLGDEAELPASDAVRGMIRKISHLLEVEGA